MKIAILLQLEAGDLDHDKGTEEQRLVAPRLLVTDSDGNIVALSAAQGSCSVIVGEKPITVKLHGGAAETAPNPAKKQKNFFGR